MISFATTFGPPLLYSIPYSSEGRVGTKHEVKTMDCFGRNGAVCSGWELMVSVSCFMAFRVKSN